MINLQFLQQLKESAKRWKVSPLLVLAGTFFILAFILSVYPHSIFQNKTAKKTAPSVKGITYIAPKVTPAITPTPTIVYRTTLQTSPTSQPTSAPSTTQQTTQSTTPTTSHTSAPKPTVNLQISEPDGTSNFSVTLNSGNNLCDNLTEAKNEGKIKSLTLDYSYMSSMHSAYVREINGYSNNWTVSVNGKTPQGCSLYTPNPEDSIVWKFG